MVAFTFLKQKPTYDSSSGSESVVRWGGLVAPTKSEGTGVQTIWGVYDAETFFGTAAKTHRASPRHLLAAVYPLGGDRRVAEQTAVLGQRDKRPKYWFLLVF